ncbi:MAG: aminotransferase class III-fold pyridoxal phosphate-dependent enzyme [Candidatus Lokiarchaeota archaeon]|nr:aminotransferase class III-fold pyridoxal phosphate-dependent enzyme [Candidatus Lokiarchaeota archaeon]
MPDKLNLKNSFKLYEEALELIPGAILGIRRPYNFVEGEYPIFFHTAKGGKVIDVDGNEYMDHLCAYGPIIIGHREEEIDNAVMDQIQNHGFCMSLTQPVQNELGKVLRELIPCAEKMVFMKMGSDATTAAIRVARAYTRREKILKTLTYAGWHDWSSDVYGIDAGIPDKIRNDTIEFEFNNLPHLETTLKQHKDQIAAVFIAPIHTPGGNEVELPEPGYLRSVKQLAHEYGAICIFDEIRTGFRINMGGAQKEFGVIPDLACFGKAMGNGYPISTLVGKAEIMDVLEHNVFLSSTFFPNSLSQIASLKTINFMQKNDVINTIKNRGSVLEKKIQESIDSSGVPAVYSGGASMPYITFRRDEQKLYKTLREEFYRQLIRRKVFLQPYHHGYICYRHTKEDLEYTATMIDESLNETKRLM